MPDPVEPNTSGDRELDQLAELLTNRAAAECTKSHVKRLSDLQVDLAKRGVSGSGMEESGKVEIAVAYMEEYCEQMVQELCDLVRKVHGAVAREDAEWIKRKLGHDLDLLKTGQAGCYVKDPAGQRSLAEYIQRKKAGLSAGLEIEVRTSALEARSGQRMSISNGSALGSPQVEVAEVVTKTDVFISHASEDKDVVARPIADELGRRGYTVWYDEYVLKLGDSLPAEIDRGLASCRFGVVILSPRFFSKNWPKRELDGLAAKEVRGGRKVVLPVWHEVDAAQVESYSPTLAAKMAVSTNLGLDRVVEEIVKVLGEERSNRPSVEGLASETPQMTTGSASGGGEPIRILGVVENEVGRPRNDGTRGSALYPIALRLSRPPSSIWADLFVQTWNHPPQYTTMHRPGIASVVGDKIILARTTIEELEEVHKETLKHVLVRVNEEAGRIETATREREAREARAQKEQDERIRAGAKRVRFDD